MQVATERLRIIVLCFTGLIDSLGYSLLVNVLPSMVDPGDPLHFEGIVGISSGLAYSIVQFMYCLGVTVFPLFVGRWSDKHGRRPLLLGCLVLISCTYIMQAFSVTIFQFAFSRFLCGVSGCLRPLAISYIADLISDEELRCKLITSLSLVSAFSVGFGPALGAHLAEQNRQYPFYFVAAASGVCALLVYLFLPEANKVGLLSPGTFARSCRGGSKFIPIYRYVLILGFSAYFMSMTAAIAFPLSLKEDFGLSPFYAGLCSVIDGPLIFLTNLAFMTYLTSLSRACKASVVAAASFMLIALVPATTTAVSLPGFLVLKYLTSIGGPICFCAIPQVMINTCPRGACGKYTGLLTGFHGAGRLTATAFVGPMFSRSPAGAYDAVAITGAVSSVVFWLLYRQLEATVSVEDLKTPLNKTSREQSMPMSRQLSMMYPTTPSGSNFIFPDIEDV